MQIWIRNTGFDGDPDPTFQADADPDPNPFTRVSNFYLKIFNYCFPSLPKLVMFNFLSKNVGGGVRDKG